MFSAFRAARLGDPLCAGKATEDTLRGSQSLYVDFNHYVITRLRPVNFMSKQTTQYCHFWITRHDFFPRHPWKVGSIKGLLKKVHAMHHQEKENSEGLKKKKDLKCQKLYLFLDYLLSSRPLPHRTQGVGQMHTNRPTRAGHVANHRKRPLSPTS